MQPVRSRRNAIVVDAARLHRAKVRRERRQTLAEGPHLLRDALRSGLEVDTVFALPDDHDSIRVAEAESLRLTLVDAGALALLSDTETPRGPVTVLGVPGQTLDSSRDVLVGVGLADPGNVGTMVRTAAAFGWDFAHTSHSADPWSPKALRAGAGGQFQTAVVAIGGIDQLETWHTVATVVKGGEELRRPGPAPVAVLVGEEAAGLPVEMVTSAQSRMTIAISGETESLNAAAAAAIIVYEMSKG